MIAIPIILLILSTLAIGRLVFRVQSSYQRKHTSRCVDDSITLAVAIFLFISSIKMLLESP
ncbi:hypothetical protein C7A17_24255 [Ectopseudomonas mendocina]|uniref:Uncharacterized protein n=1 Tax=Ectopseudomonas mendocina TaxID=300 RepID=A0A2R3QVI0_ECTME|nr:hypothetical protein C7A17_24255 [Pseudomonas mendocina]